MRRGRLRGERGYRGTTARALDAAARTAASGSERGIRLLRLVAEGGNYTFNLVREHAWIVTPRKPACWLRRVRLRRETAAQAVEQWMPLRSDLQWLDAHALRAHSGCVGYEGALLDRSGGGLNPLAYTRELGRLAKAAGASIHEESRVVEIAPVAQGGAFERRRRSHRGSRRPLRKRGKQ